MQCARQNNNFGSVFVVVSQIHISESVKSLGVLLGNLRLFNTHVDNVFRASSQHIRAFRFICRSITEDNAVVVVCSLVGARTTIL